MSIQTNHKSRRPQRRCGSSVGSSHSWRKGGADHGSMGKRFAWRQSFKSGRRNVGQSSPRRMHASPTGTGQGGSTSKPSPVPKPVEKPGGGSSPKRG